jgi:hypothetical protein
MLIKSGLGFYLAPGFSMSLASIGHAEVALR